MRTNRIRWSATLVVGLALVLVAASALPAAAGAGPRDGGERNRRIAVGDIRVEPGEVADGPLVGVDGDTRIGGTVDGSAFVARGDIVVVADGIIDGDVLVVRGDARIAGRVDGDVIVLSGRAVIRDGARIDGDVMSTKEPRVAKGARVTGDVEHIDVPGILGALGVGLLLFWWFAVTISTAVLGALLLALVPRGFEAAAATGRDRRSWWIAALVGVGLVIALPVLGIVAVSTLVGLPFGLGLLGALGLVHAVGYVAGAHFLGRCILKVPKNRFGAFFVGWAILRVAALAPGLGVLVWVAAATFGLGMLAVAGVRAAQVPRGTPPADSPMALSTTDAPSATPAVPSATPAVQSAPPVAPPAAAPDAPAPGAAEPS